MRTGLEGKGEVCALANKLVNAKPLAMSDFSIT
jgi:hypothetical protein